MLNRRDFIQSLFRNILLLVIGIVSGILIFRNQSIKNETCDFDFICKNCRELSACTLTEGLEYKKNNNAQ